MDAILLIAGLFFFWIWLHAHPVGAVVTFLAAIFTGAPAILGVDSLASYLGYSAAFALAPMTILWLYRDLKKGRDSRLAHFGSAVLDSLAPPKAQEPDVVWSTPMSASLNKRVAALEAQAPGAVLPVATVWRPYGMTPAEEADFEAGLAERRNANPRQRIIVFGWTEAGEKAS